MKAAPKLERKAGRNAAAGGSQNRLWPMADALRVRRASLAWRSTA